ncbi:TIGR03943 family protein [Candidatus Gracilibacteria bacterium]|nr:TIGR03943 family protein [Candidatus Gracilibacteria bacterium]
MSIKRLLAFGLFLAYGLALLWLWWQRRMTFFLHPDFVPLTIAAMVALFLLAFALVFSRGASSQHVQIPWWRVLILAIPLLVIFTVDVRPLSSSAALSRGTTTGALSIGRKANAGNFATNPAKRSLYQWVIALNANPEPEHYVNQPVRIKGFILHDPDSPQNQVLLARFIVTCCAADARVLSLPLIKEPLLAEAQNDQWYDIEGVMQIVTEGDKRQLVVVPTKATAIAQPDDPYEI